MGAACSWLGCTFKTNDPEKVMDIRPYNKRACTDIPCCLGFIALWVCMCSIFMVALVGPNKGDPYRLIGAVSSETGLPCAAGQVGYYPYLTLETKDGEIDPTGSMEMANYIKCATSCAVTGPAVLTDDNYDTVCNENEFQIAGVSCGYSSSVNKMTGVCYPDDLTALMAVDAGETMNAYFGALEEALPIIAACVGAGILFSFIYCWLMKHCARVVVWGAILGALVGFCLMGYTFLEKSNEPKIDENQKTTNQVIAYFGFACAALWLLIILFMRKRIELAIQVVKSASRAIGDMPMLIFFPIIPMIIYVGFFFAWVWVSLCMYSQGPVTDKYIVDVCSDTDYTTKSACEGADGTWHEGTLENGDELMAVGVMDAGTGNDFKGYTYATITYDEGMQGVFWLDLFFYLWVSQFIVYFVYIVQCGAIADWYFSERDQGSGKKMRGPGELRLSPSPITQSMKRTIRYHLGSVAFGAAIVAIIQFIRAAFEYFANQLKKGQNGKLAPIIKVLECCIRCCLWCIEKLLDFISKNSLIWVAVYGDAFCPACVSSFKLIWRNLMRVAAISMVSGWIISIGKLIVGAMSAGLCGVILMNVEPYKTNIADPLFPVIITFILTYFVGAFFMTTYATTMDTVFLCFLIDEEENGAKGKPMLADQGLMDVVAANADASKAAADSKKAGRENAVADN